MKLRIKNKKLKQRLEHVERENERYKEALYATHNELCRKSISNICTLKVRHVEIADSRRADERFIEYMKEELVHEMSREIARYITIKHHVDYSGVYPKEIYEGSIKVVKPDTYQCIDDRTRKTMESLVDAGKFDRVYPISPDELREVLKRTNERRCDFV